MGSKVLLVEDDDDAREALEVLLSNRGYETLAAEDGEAALETAATFLPDILLCDWWLPGPHDGVSVARKLQADHDIPVIFFTAHSVSELRTRTRDLNVLAYLPKPIDVMRLTAALNAAIG
jgi:DNA-binding response OmpR family regulator